MPDKLESKLMAEALAKGLSAKEAAAYTFGTMHNTTTWEPGKKGPIHGKTESGHVTNKVVK